MEESEPPVEAFLDQYSPGKKGVSTIKEGDRHILLGRKGICSSRGHRRLCLHSLGINVSIVHSVALCPVQRDRDAGRAQLEALQTRPNRAEPDGSRRRAWSWEAGIRGLRPRSLRSWQGDAGRATREVDARKKRQIHGRKGEWVARAGCAERRRKATLSTKRIYTMGRTLDLRTVSSIVVVAMA